jgi:hypothetical protein
MPTISKPSLVRNGDDGPKGAAPGDRGSGGGQLAGARFPAVVVEAISRKRGETIADPEVA